jgi:hypothetical protein
MPKHRGPILEHQTPTPASLSDFFMENATNSQEFACCSAVRPPQPPQAMVDLGLELGNKGLLGHQVASGEAMPF